MTTFLSLPGEAGTGDNESSAVVTSGAITAGWMVAGLLLLLLAMF